MVKREGERMMGWWRGREGESDGMDGHVELDSM